MPKEYIEREAAIDYIQKISEQTDNWYEESAPENPLNLLEHFKSVPAADVAEVVRCKDCKWWMNETCINANGAKGFVSNANWFCCSGERKEK